MDTISQIASYNPHIGESLGQMMRVLSLLVLNAFCSVLAAQENIFHLTYKINVNGISCGYMNFDLKEVSPGHYQAQQKWQSKILFFHLDQKEIADFEKVGDKFRPISYTFERDRSGDEKRYTYQFTNEHHAQGQSDRLSLQFVLMDYLAHNVSIIDKDINLVDDRGQYVIHPKMTQQHSLVDISFLFKKREHSIVFDKENHFLPVKFVQTRGAFVFEGSLTESTINYDKWWY